MVRDADDVSRLLGACVGLTLAGSLLVVPWLAFPHAHLHDRGLIGALVGGAVLAAIALWALRPRISVKGYSLMVAAGVAVLGLAIHYSGGAFSPLGFFYIWTVGLVSWYLPSRHLGLHVGWIILSYGLVLVSPHRGEAAWWSISTNDLSRWVLLSGTVAVSALVLRRFRRSLLRHELRWQTTFAESSTALAVIDSRNRIGEANRAFASLLGETPSTLRGVDLLELLPAEHRPGRSASRGPGSGLSQYGEAERRVRRADGQEVWVRLTLLPITDVDGRHLCDVVQAVDVTGDHLAAKRLARDAAERTAILELTRAVVRGVDFGALAQQVTSVASRLLECDLAVLLESADEQPGYRIAAWHGEPARPGWIVHWPLVERILRDGDPVLVLDWRREERIAVNAPERTLQLASTAAVAVRGRERIFGALVCGSRRPGKFDRRDLGLLRVLTGMLAEAIEHRRAEEQARAAALHDPVTGLPNRVLLSDLLRQSLAQATVGNRMAAIVVDLDRFRALNDDLGHDAGDAALREVARRLAEAARSTDVLARLAGDEFVVLCSGIAGAGAARRAAERLLESVKQPMWIGGEQIVLSATAGIAIADAEATAESLLRDASTAVRSAKVRARGSGEMFDRELAERTRGRLRCENALRQAIGSEELSIVYQPIVDLRTGTVFAAEALMRWRHPDWGPVSPLEFIPIAEETGMIIPLGRWVLEEAVRQGRSWIGDGLMERVGVNISSRQLFDDMLVELVERTLSGHDLDPDGLTLELTETALISDSAAASEVLAAIKRLGVRLALDDFGTGYASVSYLSRYPFDVVKLDLTLTRRLTVDPRDRVIVQSTIEMAHALGIAVVAEGVETDAQAQTLRSLGCDLAQGFLYGRPLPPERVAWAQEPAV